MYQGAWAGPGLKCDVDVFSLRGSARRYIRERRTDILYVGYIPITYKLAEAFMATRLMQEFPKATVFLREGDRIRNAFLIPKGCMRSYVLKD